MGPVAIVGLILSISAPAPVAGGEPVRIMVMGDSISRGWPSFDMGGYRNLLRNRLVTAGWELDMVGSQTSGFFPDNQHEAFDGIRIRTLMENRAHAQQLYDPDITLLMIGTNDIWTGTGLDGPDHVETNLNNLIARIYDYNKDAKLYVASIPRMWFGYEPLAVTRYNSAIPGIVASWQQEGKFVRFVDIYDAVGWNLFDGVHPSQTGYNRMADAWYEALMGLPHDQLAPHRRSWHTPLVPEPGLATGALLALAISRLRRAARR